MSLTKKQKDELGLQSKNYILRREYEKVLDRKTLLEVEIALQKGYDPEEESAEEVRSRDSNGRPTSTVKIKRKRYIEIKEQELEKVNDLLNAIESQFEI